MTTLLNLLWCAMTTTLYNLNFVARHRDEVATLQRCLYAQERYNADLRQRNAKLVGEVARYELGQYVARQRAIRWQRVTNRRQMMPRRAFVGRG